MGASVVLRLTMDTIWFVIQTKTGTQANSCMPEITHTKDTINLMRQVQIHSFFESNQLGARSLLHIKTHAIKKQTLERTHITQIHSQTFVPTQTMTSLTLPPSSVKTNLSVLLVNLYVVGTHRQLDHTFQDTDTRGLETE